MKRERGDTGSHWWEARLSDYLDDELTAGERLELEDHLRGCVSCAAVLEDLRAVVARADGCARESVPANDLWEGIRPRLQPRRPRAPWRRALDVFTPSPATPAWWRVPVFAAAAILVVGLASLLWLQGGTTLRPSAPGEEPGPYAQGEQGAGTLRPVDRGRALEASREYYDTVAHLRRVVEERLTHDPRVVEVLDSNLAAIDEAIAGYRDALVANPADEALKRRLELARERKVESWAGRGWPSRRQTDWRAWSFPESLVLTTRLLCSRVLSRVSHTAPHRGCRVGDPPKSFARNALATGVALQPTTDSGSGELDEPQADGGPPTRVTRSQWTVNTSESGLVAVIAVLACLILAAAPGYAAEFDRTLPATRGMRLDVRLFGGEIVVRAWDRDAVRIRATHFSTDTIDAKAEGQAITVRARSRAGRPHAIDFQIDVPAWMAVSLSGTYLDARVEGTKAGVTAETVRGNVVVRGGEGNLRLKSVEGEVVLEGAKGRAELSAVNDIVRVTGFEGDLLVDTVTGSVKIQGVNAKSATVSTVDGDIAWDAPLAPAGRYELATHDGDIDVTLPDASSASVGVRAFEGQVRSTFPVKLPEGGAARKRFTFTLGGGAAQLELETFTGTISIRQRDGRQPAAGSRQ